MKERPSEEKAMPSSSVGPEVTCSGCPSGKRWRQMWKLPSPAFELKYIQRPSGDQAAEVQAPVGGPTLLPTDVESKDNRRHGNHPASISAIRTHLPSGDK